MRFILTMSANSSPPQRLQRLTSVARAGLGEGRRRVDGRVEDLADVGVLCVVLKKVLPVVETLQCVDSTRSASRVRRREVA